MLHIVAVIKFSCYHTCEYKIKQVKRTSLVIFILRYLIVIIIVHRIKIKSFLFMARNKFNSFSVYGRFIMFPKRVSNLDITFLLILKTYHN